MHFSLIIDLTQSKETYKHVIDSIHTYIIMSLPLLRAILGFRTSVHVTNSLTAIK